MQKKTTSVIARTRLGLLALAIIAGICGGWLFASHAQAAIIAGWQSAASTDAAANALRAGRDFIEEQKWQQATEQFNNFVKSYPRHRQVDAALYWLAFALKKQGKLADADRALTRLLAEHTQSNWKDDAQAMRVEIAPQLGNRAAVNQALEGVEEQSVDEVKLIALQSLLFTNPEQALPILQSVLKPDAKASRNVKQAAVAFLGQISGGRGLETLLDVARAHEDKELRRAAIFWLGQSRDERAFAFLKERVTTAGDKAEFLDSVLFAISQSRHPQAQPLLIELARSAPSQTLRQAAINSIAMRGSDAAITELLALYDSETNIAVKQQLLFAFSSNGKPEARAKLLDVARRDANTELRKTAILWLGQRAGAVEELLELFDAETSEEVKDRLLMMMSQSRSKTALQKLMQIAKTSPSLELRKRAVFWLGQSRDPEAMKFIEEILK